MRNFPSSMSDSEFYSMFIRKGEMFSCEKKGSLGTVVFKTRAAAEAVDTLTARLDWGGGVAAARRAQALLRPLAPPVLERFQVHVAVWKAMWIMHGNKKLSKLL